MTSKNIPLDDELIARMANYDESLAGDFPLPDPLRFADGRPVRTAQEWRQRRSEILNLFETQVYGVTPRQPVECQAQVRSIEPALDGRALRKQVRLSFTRLGRTVHLDLLYYLPVSAARPVPVFMGLNFEGNPSISTDPGILLPDEWTANAPTNPDPVRARRHVRGCSAQRWPVERILARGYGLATAWYWDLDPDFDDGFQNGLHPLFYAPGQSRPAPDQWGSFGAWAWGLSRALDYLETDPAVDARRVAVLGHSRLGKTALWAGAQDERFALVIGSGSGCGGAALSRRNFGETVAFINRRFPHWFCENFKQYDDCPQDLPVDQHELIALIAPRPVYITSASEDLWADPRGEYLGAYQAGPVYRLLGQTALENPDPPALEHPLRTTVGYHIRPGLHDVTAYDWEEYLNFVGKRDW
jgi:hypothetical protein